MNDFLKMDIFFVVTTFVVSFCGILGIVALYFVIRILNNIKKLSEIAIEEANEIRDDIAGVRSKIKEEGIRIKTILEFFSNMLVRTPKRSRKNNSK